MQTSFSVVSNNLLQRLQGFNILYAGQFYYGEPRKFGNYTLTPFFSGDHLLYYVKVFKPEITVAFQSPVYLVKLASVFKLIKKQVKLMLYTPIEGYPLTIDVNSLFPIADKILVPSKYSQETLKKHGFNSEVLYHAVDTNIFKPEPKPQNFNVGSIASHVWRKQLTRIIDAHKQCVEKGYPIKLLLYTSTYDVTPWLPDLKKYAEKTNPNAYFNEAAYLNLTVNRRSIAQLYSKLHCHILTSTEAFGLPNLEAMATATVPIVIPHGASPEIVGDCGIYVKIKDYLATNVGKIALVDVEDLADKIIWAYNHPEKLRKLARKATERAKQFNWGNITNKLEIILSGEGFG